MTPVEPHPVYLVELFCLKTGGLDWADVSADLALALQEVFWHLATFEDNVAVRTSADDSGALEGIVFLRDDSSILAAITVYWLDREHGEEAEHVKSLHAAALLTSAPQLQEALSKLF